MLAAAAPGALDAARVAERDGEAGERGAHTGGVGHDEARECRRPGGVREEREPPQDDPRAEDPAGHCEEHQLDQRLAQEGQLRQVDGRWHRASLTRMILNKP